LNPPGEMGKRASSWIHPHSHGCTRGHLTKGEEDIRNSIRHRQFLQSKRMLFI
jgi:hypothetical protein